MFLSQKLEKDTSNNSQISPFWKGILAEDQYFTSNLNWECKRV